MKSQKKPEAKRLLIAVGESFNEAPIKVEEWNFALCPHPTETEACYLYEYSLESDSIIAEAEKLRQKHVLSEANRKKFEKWLRLNPMPPTQGVGAWKGGELDRWRERALKANPDVIVTTKLSYDLHFLDTCAYFPAKHWLEIPAGEREHLAKRFTPNRERFGTMPFTWKRGECSFNRLKAM